MLLLVWLCNLCGGQIQAQPAKEGINYSGIANHICDECFEKADWKKDQKDWPGAKKPIK